MVVIFPHGDFQDANDGSVQDKWIMESLFDHFSRILIFFCSVFAIKEISFFLSSSLFSPLLLSLHLSKYFSMSYIFFVLFWFTDTLLKLNDLPIKMDNSFPPSNIILKEMLWSNEADLKFLSSFFLSVLKNIINGGKKEETLVSIVFLSPFFHFFFLNEKGKWYEVSDWDYIH